MGARGNVESAADHPLLERAARLGFAVNGVLHLLIAALALAVATGTAGGQKADQAGALATVAASPGGLALLVVMTLGLCGLAVWHLAEAGFPAPDEETSDRLKNAAKAVAYAAVAVSTAKFVVGSGESSQSRASSRGFTATLMDQPAGRFLVGLVGVVVVAIGGYYVFKGLTQRFTDDLSARAGTGTTVLGTIGYVAKGISLGIVGLLFGLAAVHHRPREAAGLDAALRTLKDQPLGPLALGVVAIGLAVFGLYCFARARFQKM